MSNNNQQHTASGEAIGTLLLVVFVFALGLMWSSAELATWLFHGHFFHATDAAVANAVVHFPKHLSNPAAAWPAPFNAELPGAKQYWCAISLEVGIPALVTLGIVALVHRVRAGAHDSRRTSLDRRTRAGVVAQGRFARKRELRPLFARLPLHGRFLLGKSGWHSLATEAPWTPRRRQRTTGIGAVAIVGPSRSGKTLMANAGIIHWDGPAILLSLKTDVLDATIDARRALGDVRVFDPAAVTGMPSARWSPLSGAATTDGAMRAAHALVEAAPADVSGVSAGQFWNDMAESLIAGLMGLAANTEGRAFADVVRWVVSVDTPTDGAAGEVAPLLRALRSDTDPQRKEVAAFVAQSLEGLWRNDHRTVSSVYTTARAVVWPWVNPVVAATATDTTISAEWLLSGAHSLYVAIPLADQDRLRPVLGGLLNDLVAQVFDRFVRTNRPLDPPLLVVIDEAATLHPEQLASWVATLAGAGVQLVTIWQSLSQIDAAYGRHGQAILTNHLTKVFLPGMSDAAGLDYLGRLTGEEHLPSYLGDGWYASGDRETVATVPLMPPTVLRQMRRGRALLLHGTLPPANIELQIRRRPFQKG
jgi:type IV secretion system protein VirD4